MKKILTAASLAAALAAGGVTMADAQPAENQAKKCAKPKKVGFLVKGTFVSGDATSVTLKVTRANKHALRSGLVTVGSDYTATPKNPAKIRYRNRTGPADAQPTDRVKVKGKVTKLRKGCTDASFSPTAKVRKVIVKG